MRPSRSQASAQARPDPRSVSPPSPPGWNQIRLSSAPMSAELLWQSSPERIERATITRFARERGLPEEYNELWRWSVENLDDFWAAIWDYFSVDGSYERVLGKREMPGAEWFPGARLS